MTEGMRGAVAGLGCAVVLVEFAGGLVELGCRGELEDGLVKVLLIAPVDSGIGNGGAAAWEAGGDEVAPAYEVAALLWPAIDVGAVARPASGLGSGITSPLLRRRVHLPSLPSFGGQSASDAGLRSVAACLGDSAREIAVSRQPQSNRCRPCKHARLASHW